MSEDRLPPPGALDGFGEPAAAALAQLRGFVADAKGTIVACRESRPDGELWDAAVAELVASGDTARFASFVAGEPTRYAEALLVSRVAVAAFDDLRQQLAEDLAAAVTLLDAELSRIASELAAVAHEAWTRRDTPESWPAEARAKKLRVEGQQLAALRSWCLAEDRDFASQGRWIPNVAKLALSELWALDVARRIDRGGALPLERPSFWLEPSGWSAFVAGLDEDTKSRAVLFGSRSGR